MKPFALFFIFLVVGLLSVPFSLLVLINPVPFFVGAVMLLGIGGMNELVHFLLRMSRPNWFRNFFWPASLGLATPWILGMLYILVLVLLAPGSL